jgi:hypothetical protein
MVDMIMIWVRVGCLVRVDGCLVFLEVRNSRKALDSDYCDSLVSRLSDKALSSTSYRLRH